MSDFQWVKAKIEEAATAEHPHLRSAVEHLVDAGPALESRGGMAFGVASHSLRLTEEERRELAERSRSALVQIHGACLASGDTEMLGELDRVAKAHDFPELASRGAAIEKSMHPRASWLEVAPAGVVSLRGCDEARLEQLIAWFEQIYDGPDFGGIDYVQSNGEGPSWILMGQWRNCLRDEVRVAAQRFTSAIERAVDAVNEGMSLQAEVATTTLSLSVSLPLDDELEVSSHRAHDGLLVFEKGLAETDIQHLLRETFPTLPHWVGVQMGAPHWLGVGVRATEGRIHSVSPYIELGLLDDGLFHLRALAPESDFDVWLDAFLDAMREYEPAAPPDEKSPSRTWKLSL